jgi:hypothetical protein
VTAALTRLALYDPDSAVRKDALHELANRPDAEATDLLLEALRYPWAPVAQRAADAIVFLDRQDMVARLIDVLDGPDPTVPFEQEVQGKKVIAVRELVKVNHLHNCMLCHAPVDPKAALGGGLPLGRVPSVAEALPPPLSRVYYDERDGYTAVRADITYLRQDFSIMLPVADHGHWPKMQRFDFLVRNRVLTDAELTAWQQHGSASPLSAHRQAVLSALRRLTNLDAGPTAAAWRLATAAAPTEAPAYGRVDCRK